MVTPVKYEQDIEKETSVLMILKNWENIGMGDICLVTSTPDQYGYSALEQSPAQVCILPLHYKWKPPLITAVYDIVHGLLQTDS